MMASKTTKTLEEEANERHPNQPATEFTIEADGEIDGTRSKKITQALANVKIGQTSANTAPN